MSDLFKRLGIGAAIGIVVAILIGWGTYEIPVLKSLLDGYEFLSYDGRMRSRTENVEQMSIDDVVVIDIDNNSVAPPEEGGLGNYYDWPHAYHGQLINTVTSGNPSALLFDLIFDIPSFGRTSTLSISAHDSIFASGIDFAASNIPSN